MRSPIPTGIRRISSGRRSCTTRSSTAWHRHRIRTALPPPERQTFDALVHEAPLIDADGRHTGWMGSVLDITERKRAEELNRQQEEKLQATSRLVTMGEMASTLAHELNQPLAAISSYNTGCLNKLAAPAATSRRRNWTAQWRNGAAGTRAGKIIRRVHDFVRKSEPKIAECDLAEVIDDAIGFIEHFAQKRQVHIERDIARLATPARRSGDDRTGAAEPDAQCHRTQWPNRTGIENVSSCKIQRRHDGVIEGASSTTAAVSPMRSRNACSTLLFDQAGRHGHGPQYLPFDHPDSTRVASG